MNAVVVGRRNESFQLWIKFQRKRTNSPMTKRAQICRDGIFRPNCCFFWPGSISGEYRCHGELKCNKLANFRVPKYPPLDPSKWPVEMPNSLSYEGEFSIMALECISIQFVKAKTSSTEKIIVSHENKLFFIKKIVKISIDSIIFSFGSSVALCFPFYSLS